MVSTLTTLVRLYNFCFHCSTFLLRVAFQLPFAIVLNVVGFAAYAVFNVCLFCFERFQTEFQLRNPHCNIPVELNDVVFATHHTVIVILIACQCIYYKTGGQKMSIPGLIVSSAIFSPATLLGYYVFVGQFSKLDYIYFFSYVKLWLTAGKYLPQAIFHFKRKSTIGWSVYCSFLDLAGGVFSILQTIVLIMNYGSFLLFRFELFLILIKKLFLFCFEQQTT